MMEKEFKEHPADKLKPLPPVVSNLFIIQNDGLNVIVTFGYQNGPFPVQPVGTVLLTAANAREFIDVLEQQVGKIELAGAK